MFQRLFKNTAYSVLSFGLVSIINLLLVPFIISAYGLSAFGVLSLLKLFIPAGLLAIFDFGFSENPTIAISQYRAKKIAASQAIIRCILSFLLSLIVAGVSCFALLMSIEIWVDLLGIEDAYVESASMAFHANAWCLLLLFPLLVVDGLIKGYERYFLLRAVEIIMALLLLVGSLLIIYSNFDFAWLHLVFLGTLCIKFFILSSFAWVKVRKEFCVEGSLFNRGDVDWVIMRGKLMWSNKILGTAQNQLPLFAVGLLFNNASAGLYEIIARLPRLLKIVLSLLSSALLPFATLLDSEGDTDNMTRLGKASLLTIGLFVSPLIFFMMAFSKTILSVWVGPAYSEYWPWLSLMLCIPFFNTFISMMSTPLLGRAEVVKKLNYYMLIQVVIIFVISIFLVPKFDSMAFYVGQVAAAALLFLAQSRLVLNQIRVPVSVIRQFCVAISVNAGMLIACIYMDVAFNRLLLLLVCAMVWLSLFGTLSWFVVLEKNQKAKLKQVLYSFKL